MREEEEKQMAYQGAVGEHMSRQDLHMHIPSLVLLEGLKNVGIFSLIWTSHKISEATRPLFL